MSRASASPAAFIAGWPVAHSRSPVIHRFWLDRYNIAGDYRREAVPPESIEAFLKSFGERGYVGGNVTIPHKEAAFAASRNRGAIAGRLGAANTLWFEGGELCCDNTDAYGFAASLDEVAPEWRNGGTALVIGAGGASRAVVLAALDAGFRQIVILNRTFERAVALAAFFGSAVRGGGLDEMAGVLPTADLIVNATSAGLGGREALQVDWRAARPDAIATDLVYVPLTTPFLREAAERGLRTVDGLGMLLHQAVPGFQRWFGIRPDVDGELRRRVIADIEG